MQKFIPRYRATAKKKNLRWDKMNPQTAEETAAFLKAREIHCVTACARFLSRNGARDHVWALREETGNISALLFQSGRTLFPVFDRPTHIPVPYFMNRFLKKVPIHTVQGCGNDTHMLEYALTGMGYTCIDRIDYDLMTLDGEPNREALRAGPANLILRKPEAGDLDALYLLQAAYEKEEVLPRGAVFNPAACRRSLERIITNEYVLAAEMEGRIVGKINTNALSFSRYQIGGVYVHPDYRRRGIAVSMGAVFARFLAGAGWGLSLFVKKRNTAARGVYSRIGFTLAGDYRISYY
ncbi:MAG: GNAT family N-acetyltransferase [Spirochaetaceae bacterium]|jgi:ribosomal protein S18 acetylase RimI-like enzyme|nr:GNAT family N-acetyltransferase [Spirochaetaceae bacterium]